MIYNIYRAYSISDYTVYFGELYGGEKERNVGTLKNGGTVKWLDRTMTALIILIAVLVHSMEILRKTKNE